MTAMYCILGVIALCLAFLLGYIQGYSPGEPTIVVSCLEFDGKKFPVTGMSGGRFTIIDPNREALDYVYDRGRMTFSSDVMLMGYTSSSDGKSAFVTVWEDK